MILKMLDVGTTRIYNKVFETCSDRKIYLTWTFVCDQLAAVLK